jgi:hypothetical protein
LTRKKRDYPKEFTRRKERGRERGLSGPQMRGHPRAGELPLRAKPRPQIDALFERAFKRFRETGNATRSAKEFGLGGETFRRRLYEKQLATHRGRKWVITDNRPKPVVIYSEGRRKELVAAGLDQASLAGSYWNDANAFLEDPDPDRTLLKPYVGRSVIDVRGVAHPLETDPDAIYEAATAGGLSFEEIYRPVA